jgi:hypothetical protein
MAVMGTICILSLAALILFIVSLPKFKQNWPFSAAMLVIMGLGIFIAYSDETGKDYTDMGVAKVRRVFHSDTSLVTEVILSDGSIVEAVGYIPNAQVVSVIKYELPITGLMGYKCYPVDDDNVKITVEFKPPIPVDSEKSDDISQSQ